MWLLAQITGAVLVLVAFILVQVENMSSNDLSFLLLNSVGAAILAADAGVHEAWGFLVLEAVWAAVSAVGLARLTRRDIPR